MTLITTIIPHIPIRTEMLKEAVGSVGRQILPPNVASEILVVTDTAHRGAAVTIAEGVGQSTGDWITLCADDDWLEPNHHERLLLAQIETGADVIYPWYNMIGQDDFQPDRFGQPFDAARFLEASFIPGGGSLIRGDLLRSAGIPQVGDPEFPMGRYDDWAMYLRLYHAGATFYHLPERLYNWRVWAGNTSGRGERW